MSVRSFRRGRHAILKKGLGLFRKWRRLYGRAVDGPQTVECDHCGYQVFGNSPSIVIECWLCYKKLHTTRDLFVVLCRREDASEWVAFTKRRAADRYAARMKGQDYRIKKSICAVPVYLGKPSDNPVIEYIQEYYPHRVGED